MTSITPVIVGLAAGIGLILTFVIFPSFPARNPQCHIEDLESVLAPVKNGQSALLIVEKLDVPATASFPEVSFISYLKYPEFRKGVDEADVCHREAVDLERQGPSGSYWPPIRLAYWTHLEVEKASQLINEPSLHFVHIVEQAGIPPSEDFRFYDSAVFVQAKGSYHISLTLSK